MCKHFTVGCLALSLLLLGVNQSMAESNANTNPFGNGVYVVTDQAPDNMKTTPQQTGQRLHAVNGTPTPVRPFDQGVVRVSSKSDNNQDGSTTVTFVGRSPNWGCAYHVDGTWKGGGGPPDRPKSSGWYSDFNNDDPLRIVIEVNEDGIGDDVVLFGGTGTLRVWVLGATGTVQVNLSTNPTGIVSGLPGSDNVTAGESTPKPFTLTGGQSGGQTTITASKIVGDKTISDSRTVTVLAFRGKIIPDDNFTDRSLAKLGVGETGTKPAKGLGVELAVNTTLNALKPLTWAKTAGFTFYIGEKDTDTGTASFAAGRFFEDVTLTLTDKFGNQVAYPISVVPPNGVHQVKAAEGKYPPNACGAYMALYSYLLPKDVSFWKIEVAEDMCEGVGRESQAYRTREPHPAWMTTAGVSQGNLATGCLVEGPTPAGAYGTVHPYDFVNMSDRLDIGSGTFEWNIPWKYRVGSNGYLTPFTKVLQKAQYDGQQSITIFKDGAKTIQMCP